MHELGRSVRFSVNPFLEEGGCGYNSYASNPAGQGLALFFELRVELRGVAEQDTGFVVNVTQIDAEVRRSVVPLFEQKIREAFGAGRHVGFGGLVELLRSSWGALAGRFGAAQINRLTLKLNPYRELEIKSVDSNKALFSERFEFAATHKLWNDRFSEQKNFEVFGKCANPAGHGHNYVLEVSIEIETGGEFDIVGFERIVNDAFIEGVDHRNLNTEVPDFGRLIPTVENIAAVAWNRLAGRFEVGSLEKVTVWETDKTYCSYYG